MTIAATSALDTSESKCKDTESSDLLNPTIVVEEVARNELAPNVTPPYAAYELERVGDRVTIYRTARTPYWYIGYSVDGKQFRRSLKTTSKKLAMACAKRKDAELILNIVDANTKPAPKIRDAAQLYLRSL